MKIYFKQTGEPSHPSPFLTLGITDCSLKHLYIDNDASKVTRKAHHHNGFEIHIIEKGHQKYEIDGKLYSAKSGEFFFIPPLYETQNNKFFSRYGEIFHNLFKLCA